MGTTMKKAAILAAGEGSRLKSLSSFKPMVMINGQPLLEITLSNLQLHQFQQIVLIFNELEKTMDLTQIPSLKTLPIEYFYKTTKSSMHSLYEVVQRLELKDDEHFFVSMVDSIVKPEHIENFYQFCSTLHAHESALMVTSHIEDEKPLTLKINADKTITGFQVPIDKDVYVTSGIYYFSTKTLPLLFQMIEEGHDKMRNFLTELIVQNHTLRAFVVDKTLDIDRPEDIQSVELFLKEGW